MWTLSPQERSFSGFTLIELMIVVAIIGILAATAIPLATRYQLRSKSAEAKTNLAAIRVVEEVYFSEQGRYLAAAAEPAVIPGMTRATFDLDHPAFSELGWNPEGDVYFSYAVAISADATGYTVDAGADIDGDGVLQIWGYTSPTELGAIVPGGIGCDATLLTPKVIGSCVADNTVY